MSELDTNIPVSDLDTEEIQQPLYHSQCLLDKDLYYSFASISFHQLKKLLALLLILITYLYGSIMLNGNYTLSSGCSVAIATFTLILCLRVEKGLNVNYERSLLANGKDITISIELFTDKIVSYGDGSKREYHYTQVSQLFENEHFLLLHLKHNLYIIFCKDNLNNIEEIKTFLIQQCTLVKKKKFISCQNDKKWVFALSIAMAVISFATFIGSFVLFTLSTLQ